MGLLWDKLLYKLLNAALAVVFMTLVSSITSAQLARGDDQTQPQTPQPTTDDGSGDDTDCAQTLMTKIPI